MVSLAIWIAAALFLAYVGLIVFAVALSVLKSVFGGIVGHFARIGNQRRRYR